MGIFTQARESSPPLRTAVPSRADTSPPTTPGGNNTPHTQANPHSPLPSPSPSPSHSHSHLRLYLHSRLPRLRSHPNLRSTPLPVLSSAEIVELRALQRTFEGAYMRTALSQFSFALLVLKIFTREFYPIGALYAAFGVCVFAISILRRKEGNKQFFVVVHEEKLPDSAPLPAATVGNQDQGGDVVRESREAETGTGAGSRVKVNAERWFRTSGNVVCAITGLSVVSYVALLVLIFRLGK